MTFSEYLSIFLLVTGAAFFLAGTIGLLRFPDVFTRLHALTKADNVGFGLMALGLSIQAESWMIAGQILLTWILTMFAGANVAYLITNGALRRGLRIWKR